MIFSKTFPRSYLGFSGKGLCDLRRSTWNLTNKHGEIQSQKQGISKDERLSSQHYVFRYLQLPCQLGEPSQKWCPSAVSHILPLHPSTWFVWWTLGLWWRLLSLPDPFFTMGFWFWFHSQLRFQTPLLSNYLKSSKPHQSHFVPTNTQKQNKPPPILPWLEVTETPSWTPH